MMPVLSYVPSTVLSKTRLGLFLCSAAILTACGGGGGSDSGGGKPSFEDTTNYDGSWNVDISSASCINATGTLTIANGEITGAVSGDSNDFTINGSVDPNGVLTGSGTADGYTANFSGQLSANQGNGTYTSTFGCSGTWSITKGDGSATSTSGTGKLNDTGITISTVDGDDAEYGRDALAAAGQLTKIGGGNAGFDFIKLDANGNSLSESATEWRCVRDNHTGLIWEVKTDDGGLQDKNNTYTWYNPDDNINGGNKGDENNGVNTHQYAADVNAQGLCGANDWRMPTKEELRSIVDYSTYAPAIDTDYFPNTQSNRYWSSSPYANGSNFAWFVDFYYGSDFPINKSNDRHVRLVRAEQ